MKNDVLFDIGFDMDKLEGKEKLFYEEEDYIMSPFEDAQEPDTMNSTVLSVSDENSILNLSSSVNRSGYVCCTAVQTDAGVQTENPSPD